MKDEYKEGLLIYRTMPDLRDPEFSLQNMKPSYALVELLVPQLFHPDYPAPEHPPFKVTIMQIEGNISLEMLEEALTSRLIKFLDQALGKIIMVNAVFREPMSLKLYTINTPLQPGLCDLVHDIRQWLLFYLHDENFLTYKIYSCLGCSVRQTPSHKCFIPECKLEFCNQCNCPSDVRKRLRKRGERLAQELLVRRTETQDSDGHFLNPGKSTPEPEEIRLSVNISQNAWLHLIKNGHLRPNERILESGLLELDCEIASGPPGYWRQLTKESQADQDMPPPAQDGHSSELEKGDIVIRKGEAAVIMSIDRSCVPAFFVLRIFDSSTDTFKEVNCERHDFLAKGDPRLNEIISGQGNGDSLAPRETYDC